MARLETQIHQIFLIHPQSKKNSLVLYEEALNPSLQLFLVLELANIIKKTEVAELKKISEIILTTFRSQKKLGAENLFESSLAQVNQSLADLAHSGYKSWLGKFSALVGLKTSDTIFVANTGHTTCLLKRKSELSTIISSEKPGSHPLKTFVNFTSGKLRDGDDLIFLTTSILNFVAVPLLAKTIEKYELGKTVEEIAKILQVSAGKDEAFAAFFIHISKDLQTLPISTYEAEIYAPLPEQLILTKSSAGSAFRKLAEKFSLKSQSLKNFKIPRFKSLSGLSPAAKFFLACFIIFLVVLLLNVTVFAVKHYRQKTLSRIQQLSDTLNKDLTDAQSALIYNDEANAIILHKQAQTDFTNLKNLDSNSAQGFAERLQGLSNRIEHKSVIENPSVKAQLKKPATNLIKAGTSFIFADQANNSFQAFDGKNLNELFFLNKLDANLTGIAHVPNNGTFALTQNNLYKLNLDQKQFDLTKQFANADLMKLMFLSPNRIYVLNRTGNQVLRMSFNKTGLSNPESLLKTKIDLNPAVDFGLDTNLYLLYPDKIKKLTNGIEQIFSLATLSNPMQQANRIFVGNNLYVLEAAKKRLLIFAKNGKLLNQIYLPNANQLSDLYVNENSRSIDLLDSPRLLEITF